MLRTLGFSFESIRGAKAFESDIKYYLAVGIRKKLVKVKSAGAWARVTLYGEPDTTQRFEQIRELAHKHRGIESRIKYVNDNPRRKVLRPSTARSRRAAAAPELDLDATYRVRGYPGIAFYTRGYATEQQYIPDINDYETVEDRSRAVMVMVGDDRKHIVDIDDLTVLPEDEYCQGCGQIGCGHDVRGG